ncbi:MAG: class I SAM-dependent methyltransferase [Patescibacteria group bacterium]
MIQDHNNWEEYELLDSGADMKLERFGSTSKGFVLSRPDPQAIWPKTKPESEWKKADAYYVRSEKGGGTWHFKRELPTQWEINYKKLKFYVRPTDFKHTGIFPEQSVNWDWIDKIITEARRPISVLNLFAYTGGATLAAAGAGASVTHVDASQGMVKWAGDNLHLSNLEECPVRFIVDDVAKFVAKENRRGKKYDAIIMDPPSFGRGAKGEIWKIEEMLWPLILASKALLSNEPLFFMINSYTTGLSKTAIENMMRIAFAKKGKIETAELGIAQTNSSIMLPAGNVVRWIA